MNGNRRLKDRIKGGIKHVAAAAGRAFPAAPGSSRILTYHSVGYRDHEMTVTPDSFRAQMMWLAENATVIPLADAARAKPGVALTFDDGYLDNLRIAAPVLDEMNFPATVFVVAGKLGGRLRRADDPDRDRLMTVDEIKELESIGVSIGGHTLTHPRLSRLGESEQREEIAGCAGVLEDVLGHAVDAFAYPYGSLLDYDHRTRSLVIEAGYLLAVSNRYGVNRPGADRFTLRRIGIDRTDSPQFFAAKVSGLLDNLSVLDTSMSIRLRRLGNLLLSIE